MDVQRVSCWNVDQQDLLLAFQVELSSSPMGHVHKTWHFLTHPLVGNFW